MIGKLGYCCILNQICLCVNDTSKKKEYYSCLKHGCYSINAPIIHFCRISSETVCCKLFYYLTLRLSRSEYKLCEKPKQNLDEDFLQDVERRSSLTPKGPPANIYYCDQFTQKIPTTIKYLSITKYSPSIRLVSICMILLQYFLWCHHWCVFI